MTELLLATRSAGKIREITAALNLRWRSLDDFPSISEAIEDGDTFLANATRKAVYYSNATGLPALADDSGLEVDALNGEPGVQSAYYAGHPRDDAANCRKLVQVLRDVPAARRSARFRCVMVIASGERVLAETNGAIEGIIIDEPRGTNGFGYDPHFLVPSLGKTTAELPSVEKNKISHRGIALRAMCEKLATLQLG
ncbi:MAG: RdgB/HAM1 family non-canonical purine NTP pyrophosphatase [Phycisphaerae bacterium]